MLPAGACRIEQRSQFESAASHGAGARKTEERILLELVLEDVGEGVRCG